MDLDSLEKEFRKEGVLGDKFDLTAHRIRESAEELKSASEQLLEAATFLDQAGERARTIEAVLRLKFHGLRDLVTRVQKLEKRLDAIDEA